MTNQRRIRRMQRRGLACRDLGRECNVQTEYDEVYCDTDGRTFRVRRLGCVACGRQTVVASERGTGFVPPAWRAGAGEEQEKVEANF